MSGRVSPAPGGREGLKEIARGRDRGRNEGKGIEEGQTRRRHRKRKDQDRGDGTLLKKEEGRCSC